jgi:uncharacterized protein (DUF4213/DUF364 family)
MGVSYTWIQGEKGCPVIRKYRNYEHRPAQALLEFILSDIPLFRSLALACINALNYKQALSMNEDDDNSILYKQLGITGESRVAMVGFFKPVVEYIRSRGASLEAIDLHQHVGDPDTFFAKLSSWPTVCIISATAFLNNSMESILSHIPSSATTLVLGPTTPMVPEIYGDFPVHILGGTVPLQTEMVEQVIRHGSGTPAIQKHSKKVTVTIS